MTTYRDPIRVTIGRRIQRLGRWVAHGGRPHEWMQDLILTEDARCRRCGLRADADMVLKHGALTGRCPK